MSNLKWGFTEDGHDLGCLIEHASFLRCHMDLTGTRHDISVGALEPCHFLQSSPTWFENEVAQNRSTSRSASSAEGLLKKTLVKYLSIVKAECTLLLGDFNIEFVQEGTFLIKIKMGFR